MAELSLSFGDGVSPGVGFFGYATGKKYGPTIFGGASASRTLAANRIYYSPFYCQEAKTFTEIGVNQSGAAPTGNVRLGVYNNAAGVPSTLLIDAGVVAFPGSTGLREVTASITLAARTPYWLAFVADAAVVATGVGVSTNQNLMASMGDYNDFYLSSNGWYGAVFAAMAYAALPASATAPTDNNDFGPLVYLKG